MATRGISGVGVAMAAVGGFLVYIGIRSVPLVEGIREIASGRTPTPRPRPDDGGQGLLSDLIAGITRITERGSGDYRVTNPGGTDLNTVGGGSTSGKVGPALVAYARRYIGIRYVFGGHSPSGFDCSGLVTYILVHDMGYRNLPNQTHTVVSRFLLWKGAYTVPVSDIQPGDLVCWPGSHMGIAVSRTRMIHAPRPGKNVQEANIWFTPRPVIRRVRPVGAWR